MQIPAMAVSKTVSTQEALRKISDFIAGTKDASSINHAVFLQTGFRSRSNEEI